MVADIQSMSLIQQEVTQMTCHMNCDIDTKFKLLRPILLVAKRPFQPRAVQIQIQYIFCRIVL